jgi:hypothetical protein
MGLLDSVFGGGGGSSPEITQANLLSGEQTGFLNNLISGLGNILGRGLTPVNFQAPTASPLQQLGFGFAGNLGQTGFNLANQLLGQVDPSRIGGLLSTAQGALQEGLQGFDPSRITEAFEPSRQLALQSFERDIIPSIQEALGATSGESGPLNVALSEAGRDLSLGLRAQTAPFLGQAALAAPGQQFAGANLASILAGLPGQIAGQGFGLGSNAINQILGAGGQQFGIQSGLINALNQSMLQPQQLLGQFGPLALGTRAFENIVTPGTQETGFGDILGAFGPALGQFAGSEAGSALISSGLQALPGLLAGI